MDKIQDENAASSVEVRSRQCGGLGLVTKQNPKTFSPLEVDEAFAFFQENGFAVVRNAYTSDELQFLNAFFDETQATCPRAWGQLSKRPYYTLGHPLVYSQPLLDHPELDKFTMHPNTFPLVRKIMNNEPRYSEFNFRDVPFGSGPLYKAIGFHRDRSLEDRIFRREKEPIDDVCCIHYLTDVDENTPCFALIPKSSKFKTVEEAYRILKDQYAEVPIYGAKGTCILYDISIFHTKLDGKNPYGLARRTVHQYFARGGWLGNRPPTPPLTSWNLIPKRLCLSMDPFKRKFFSHWNTSQCEWVASDFSMKFRANHPRAIGTKFNGFDSKSETDSGLKSREIMPFSKL